MKKMMKRLTALLLALALIAGQVVVPTGAAEEPTTPDSSQQGTPGPESTPEPAPEPVPEPAPQPDYDTGPVTTTDSSGKETTTQESQKTSSDGTVTTEKNVSTEQNITNRENTYSKDVYTWENEKTEDPKDTTVTNGDGSVTVTTGEKVTTEVGNHTEETTRHWRPNNEEQVTEVSYGSSTTTEVNTVVETTTEKDTILKEDPDIPDLKPEEKDPALTDTGYGDTNKNSVENEDIDGLVKQTDNAYTKDTGEDAFTDPEFEQTNEPKQTITYGTAGATEIQSSVTVDPLRGTTEVEVSVARGQSATVVQSYDPTEDLIAYIKQTEGATVQKGDTEIKVDLGDDGVAIIEPTWENGQLVGYTKKVEGKAQTTAGGHTAANVTKETSEAPVYDKNPDGSRKSKVENTMPALPDEYDWNLGEDIKDDAGKVIGKRQEIKDAEGKVIGTREITIIEENGKVGYRITTDETTYRDSTRVLDPVPTTVDEQVSLPARPQEVAEHRNSDGHLEKMIVKDIYEKDAQGNDVLVGYECETIITLADGTPYGSRKEVIRGTLTTTTTVNETPETDKVQVKTEKLIFGTTTTQFAEITSHGETTETLQREVSEENFQLVKMGSGYYIWNNGELQKVEEITDANGVKLDTDGFYAAYKVGLSGVTAGKGHGEEGVLAPLSPDLSLVPGSYKMVDGKMVWTKSGDLNMTTGMRVPYAMGGDGTKSPKNAADGYTNQLIGYGLQSAYRVADQNPEWKNNLLAHQFVLKAADGTVYYTYCADFDVSPDLGSYYNKQLAVDANYLDTEQAQMVSAIAQTGFWGTKSGVGSLASVQNWFKTQVQANSNYYKNTYGITVEDIDDLNEGMAETATQTAIWKFANSNKNKPMVLGDHVSVNINKNDGETPEDAQKLMDALYHALTVDLKADKDAGNPFKGEAITADNFATGATVKVQEKLENEYANDGGEQRQLYSTEVEVEMSVEYSKITGNLVVKIVDSAGKTHTQQLATSNSNFFGKVLADGKQGSAIKFENVKIGDGMSVTVTIDGDQTLESGAYLFTAKNYESQTFVGVSTKTQGVNLSAEISLEVDPELKIEGSGEEWTEEKTTTQKWSKTDEYQRQSWQTQTYYDEGEKVTTYGTRVTEVEKVEEIVTQAEWDSYETYTESSGGGTPRMGFRRFRGDTTDLKEFEAGLTILDEPVPLAAAPITGDVSAIWGVVSAASVAAYFMMSKKRKDD